MIFKIIHFCCYANNERFKHFHIILSASLKMKIWNFKLKTTHVLAKCKYVFLFFVFDLRVFFESGKFIGCVFLSWFFDIFIESEKDMFSNCLSHIYHQVFFYMIDMSSTPFPISSKNTGISIIDFRLLAVSVRPGLFSILLIKNARVFYTNQVTTFLNSKMFLHFSV